MTELSNPDHAGWFRDVHRVLEVVEVTPGLPVPNISSERAAFRFTGITHARDAAEAVACAETILSYALHLTFVRREALAGDDTMRYILEAFMPSGLAVDIVAKAEHMSAQRDPAQARPELTGAAA